MSDERRRHEAELSDRRDFEKAILDAALDAIVTIDTECIVVEWNRMAEDIFGFSRAEAIGKDMQFIVPPELRAAHRAGIDRYNRTGVETILRRRIEVKGLHKDGHVFPIELGVSPISVSGRRYFTSRIRDITERLNREAALKRALEAERELVMALHHYGGNDIQVMASGIRLLKAHVAADKAIILEEMEARARRLADFHAALSARVLPRKAE